MIIYGEYLFVQNFITGLILLKLTEKLSGIKVKLWRLVCGGIIGGVGSFLIFLPMCGLSMVLKLVLAVVMGGVTFGKGKLLKVTAIFLVLTFVSGGAVMAILLVCQTPAIGGNGVLYMGNLTYLKLLIFSSGGITLCWWFVGLVGKQSFDNSMIGIVTIRLEKEIFKLPAFVDSGNSLVDPISGRGVALIDRKGLEKNKLIFSNYPERFRAIPFESVGTSKGIIMGIRVDSLTFRGITKQNVIVGEYEGEFEGFRVLLGPYILERGLLEYGDCNESKQVD